MLVTKRSQMYSFSEIQDHRLSFILLSWFVLPPSKYGNFTLASKTWRSFKGGPKIFFIQKPFVWMELYFPNFAQVSNNSIPSEVTGRRINLCFGRVVSIQPWWLMKVFKTVMRENVSIWEIPNWDLVGEEKWIWIFLDRHLTVQHLYPP